MRMKKKIVTTQIQLTTHDGIPMADSRMVAEKFGKLHKNVLRDIASLKKDCPEEFARLNFEPSDYQDTTGRAHCPEGHQRWHSDADALQKDLPTG